MKDKPLDYYERLKISLSIIICAIIRDFWVVEHREKVFGSSVRSRKFPCLKQDSGKENLYYLPRIRYTGYRENKSKDLDYKSRRAHWVSGHLRKALKSSERQIYEAKKHGIHIPDGYTFVRPHKRGDKAKERIYRSRSAMEYLCLIDNLKDIKTRDLWFQYELNVKKWLESNGIVVEHISASKRGDGGIDLRAIKGSEHLLIQCKFWKNPVGVSILRDLSGSLQDFPDGSKGVVITSSHLSSEAKDYSIKHNIQFIENILFENNIDNKISYK